MRLLRCYGCSHWWRCAPAVHYLHELAHVHLPVLVEVDFVEHVGQRVLLDPDVRVLRTQTSSNEQNITDGHKESKVHVRIHLDDIILIHYTVEFALAERLRRS